LIRPGAHLRHSSVRPMVETFGFSPSTLPRTAVSSPWSCHFLMFSGSRTMGHRVPLLLFTRHPPLLVYSGTAPRSTFPSLLQVRLVLSQISFCFPPSFETSSVRVLFCFFLSPPPQARALFSFYCLGVSRSFDRSSPLGWLTGSFGWRVLLCRGVSNPPRRLPYLYHILASLTICFLPGVVLLTPVRCAFFISSSPPGDFLPAHPKAVFRLNCRPFEVFFRS